MFTWPTPLRLVAAASQATGPYLRAAAPSSADSSRRKGTERKPPSPGSAATYDLCDLGPVTASLSVSFLICNLGIVVPTSHAVVKIKRENAREKLLVYYRALERERSGPLFLWCSSLLSPRLPHNRREVDKSSVIASTEPSVINLAPWPAWLSGRALACAPEGHRFHSCAKGTTWVV